jgi:hypothetical protein
MSHPCDGHKVVPSTIIPKMKISTAVDKKSNGNRHPPSVISRIGLSKMMIKMELDAGNKMPWKSRFILVEDKTKKAKWWKLTVGFLFA